MSKIAAENMTARDFKHGDFEIALLPVGALENHGDHLPFGQDAFVAHHLAQGVAERVDRTLVLPPLFFGMSEHYQHAPFSISMSSETMIAVLMDVFASCYRWGIKRIIVINGHDGNLGPIEIAGRRFKVENPDVTIAAVERWWELPGLLLPEGTFDVWNGLGHAGEGEASIALHYFPELVHLDQTEGFVVPNEPPHISIKWTFDELTPYGTTGDPTKATAAKGEAMAECVISTIVDFIHTMRERSWRPSTAEPTVVKD